MLILQFVKCPQPQLFFDGVLWLSPVFAYTVQSFLKKVYAHELKELFREPIAKGTEGIYHSGGQYNGSKHNGDRKLQIRHKAVGQKERPNERVRMYYVNPKRGS